MTTEHISTAHIPQQPVQVDVHAPEALTLAIAGDIRSGLMAGRAFVMQVAHPQVGAGVGQLSNFRNDPWHRLREISKSGERFAFSGRAAAVAEGKRLRELHRDIKGIDQDGNPFHSLNPKVYGWVHTVFLDTLVTQCALFGTPLTHQQEVVLFGEWRESGRLFGLRDVDMPASLDQYWRFYNEMIQDSLTYNDVIDSILTLQAPAPDALRWLPTSLWRFIWQGVGNLNTALTLYALPPAFRTKISAHITWDAHNQRSMQRFARTLNMIVSRLPERARYTRVGYRARHPDGGD